MFADWTSVHGIVWYTRVKNRCIKGLILVFALCVVFGLPAFVAWSIVEFVLDFAISNTCEENLNLFLRRQTGHLRL